MKRRKRTPDEERTKPYTFASIVWRALPWAMVIGIALALRIYDLSETIRFRGDHGLDLLVVRAMETEGHRPLIGTFLSLQRFSTPPTFYYLTWAALHLTGSVEGIVYINFAVNILAMLILMRLVYEMAGKIPALTTGLAFAASSVMIEHARNFWNPYPIQIFLIISLFLLWRAFDRRKAILLWGAVLSYVIALSVYPSPALLLPYIIYQSFRWYRYKTGYGKFPATGLALLTVFLPGVFIYMPQIIFEISRGYPSLHVVGAEIPMLTNIDQILMRIGENVFYLLFSVTRIESLFHHAAMYITLVMLLLFFRTFRWRRIPANVRAFLSPGMLACGLIMFSLYSKDVYSHRSWAYLPFIYVFLGLAFSYGWRAGGHRRLIIGSLSAIYIALNIFQVVTLIRNPNRNELKESRKVASFIADDIRSNGIRGTDMSVFHKIPNDPGNGSYRIYRILYWLEEKQIIKLRINARGNIPVFDYMHPDIKPHMYIVCSNFPSYQEAAAGCLAPIMRNSEYGIRKHTKIGLTDLFAVDVRQIRQ